ALCDIDRLAPEPEPRGGNGGIPRGEGRAPAGALVIEFRLDGGEEGFCLFGHCVLLYPGSHRYRRFLPTVSFLFAPLANGASPSGGSSRGHGKCPPLTRTAVQFHKCVRRDSAPPR